MSRRIKKIGYSITRRPQLRSVNWKRYRWKACCIHLLTIYRSTDVCESIRVSIGCVNVLGLDHRHCNHAPYDSDGYCLAAQRWASGVPLAASIDRGERWHATCLKNAPGLGPRQRHHLHAMLGGWHFENSLKIRCVYVLYFFDHRLLPIANTINIKTAKTITTNRHPPPPIFNTD